jgi:hypothetical protein
MVRCLYPLQFPHSLSHLIVFSYLAYGLRILSPIPLAPLSVLPPLSPEEADVVVHLNAATEAPPGASANPYGEAALMEADAESATLAWAGVGQFVVRNGREVVITPTAGCEEHSLCLFFIGPVLATLLHQRGMLVLHASAVLVDGEAVAFLGGSGWGKSTLAGAFYSRGYTMMSDDLVAVCFDGERLVAMPGFPQLKLWPESATALGDDAGALPQLHAHSDKRARRLHERYATEAAPLAQICLLDWGENLQMVALNSQDALLQLMAHSYCAALIDTSFAPQHFKQCAEVASRIPVARLTRPNSLPLLPEIVKLIVSRCHPEEHEAPVEHAAGR